MWSCCLPITRYAVPLTCFQNTYNCFFNIIDTVSFISEPRNMTVVEGEAVRFECDFDGSDLTPSWIINNSVYYHTDLPHPYLFNNQDFSLTIEMVSLLLSGTTFRCIVGRTESVEGLLVVIKAYSHHDHSSQDSTVTVSQHSFIQPPKGEYKYYHNRFMS